jgi:hypothetical protein
MLDQTLTTMTGETGGTAARGRGSHLSEVLQQGSAPQAWVDAARAWERSTHGPTRFWTQMTPERDHADQAADFHRNRAEWGAEFERNSDLSVLWLSLHPRAWADLHHVRLPPESGDHYRDHGRLLAFEPGFADWVLAQARKLNTHPLTGNPEALRRYARHAFEWQPMYRSSAYQARQELHALEQASRAVKNFGEAIAAEDKE